MTTIAALPPSLNRLLLVPQNETDTDRYDLCDTFKGRYLDVIRNDVNGTWYGNFDNQRVVEPQTSREATRAMLLQWVFENVLHGRRPRADRGQGRKALREGDATVSVTLRMTESQRTTLAALGGAAWVRERLDEASTLVSKSSPSSTRLSPGPSST